MNATTSQPVHSNQSLAQIIQDHFIGRTPADHTLVLEEGDWQQIITALRAADITSHTAELVARFNQAVEAIPFVADRVRQGQQFNAYETTDQDIYEPEDSRFSLMLGPIYDARWLVDVVGEKRGKLLESAIKLAHHMSRVSARKSRRE